MTVLSALLLLGVLQCPAGAEVSSEAKKIESGKSEQKKSPQRMVEIQWGEAENAAQYIVEIRHFEGSLLKTFTSKKPLLRFKAPIGDYEIRAKVEGIDGRVGEFSEWNRITVAPRALVFKDSASPKTVEADPKTLTGNLKLSWPAEDTAKEYTVKIYASDKSIIQELTLDSLSWQVELPPGEYTYSVTSVSGKFTSDEVFSPSKLIVGNAQLAPPELTLHGADLDPLKPKLNWKAQPGVSYRVALEYHQFLAEEFTPVEQVPEPKDGQWSPKENSPPGQYRVTLWAEAKGWRPSQPIVEEFAIKPSESGLATIESDLEPALQLDQ